MIDVFFSFHNFEEFSRFYDLVISEHPEFWKNVLITGEVYRDYLKYIRNINEL